MPVIPSPSYLGCTILGNYDYTENYKCPNTGTCFGYYTENLIVNMPFHFARQKIVDNDTMFTNIAITSNQFDRYNGLVYYLQYLKQRGITPRLILPNNLCANLDLNLAKYPWNGTLYNNRPIYKLTMISDDITQYTEYYNDSTNLYNRLVSLGNSNQIYLKQHEDYIFTLGYVNLRPNTCEKISNYALVTTYVSQDNTIKEMIAIVDYRFSNIIHDFLLTIKDNYTRLRIAWYHDPLEHEDSNKITTNQINTYVDVTLRDLITKVDNNDDTLLNTDI